MSGLATLPIRDGVLELATTDTGVLALIAASSFYPQMQPAKAAWPFVRWGAPTGTVLRATCVLGQDISCALHIFSKGKFDGDTQLQTAEDHADAIASAVTAAVDRRRFPIPGGIARVRVETIVGPMRDRDTPDGFHIILNLRVRCIA